MPQLNNYSNCYGLFWMANSINTTLLGRENRKVREKAFEKNKDFQIEMERARFLTEDERMQKEIAFKRRLIAVSREYRQEETRASFNEQMKAVELKYYLQHCWPLDPNLPYVILKELDNNKSINSNLNVILMRAPLLPLKGYGTDANKLDRDIYANLEYNIMNDDIPLIGNIIYRKDACIRPDMKGGNASIMNIHFLMSQMPTLVVSPHCYDGKMYLTGAVWEPQASRPLIRPLLNFDFEPVKAENDEMYRQQMIDLFHTCISIIIGSVRDSYMMITQGKEPTLPELLNDKGHEKMRQIVISRTDLKEFALQENKNILEALDDKKTPGLLEVFNKEDIESIKKQVYAYHINL